MAAAFLVVACEEEKIRGFEELPGIPSECISGLGAPVFPDGISIANEILTEETDDLQFDRGERDALATEIEGVIAQVRTAVPAAADIHAPRSLRWQLSVYFTNEASVRLRGTNYTPLEGTLASSIGAGAFDALSARLGSKAMRVRWYENSSGMSVELCLDDPLNVRTGADQYMALADVESAGPPGLVGDVPALDMRKRDGVWYVVVREAGGDCPAGCTEETLHLLRVDDAGVTTITEAEVANDSLFTKLVDLTRRGPQYSELSPSETTVVS